MSTAVEEPASVGDVLRNFNFSVYYLTAFVSNAGTFMQGVGVPFVMYELTKSNTWVGASVFAVMIPSLLMGPIVGPLADRRDRRMILLGSSIVQFIAATALWLLVDQRRAHSVAHRRVPRRGRVRRGLPERNRARAHPVARARTSS